MTSAAGTVTLNGRVLYLTEDEDLLVAQAGVEALKAMA